MTQSEILMTVETEGTPTSVAFHPSDNFSFMYTTGSGMIVFRCLVPPDERSESEVSSGDLDVENRFKPRAIITYKQDLGLVVWETRWTEKYLFLNARTEVLVAAVVEVIGEGEESGKEVSETATGTRVIGLKILQRIEAAVLPPPPEVPKTQQKQQKTPIKPESTHHTKTKVISTPNTFRGRFSAIFYDYRTRNLFLGHDEGWISVFQLKDGSWSLWKTLIDAGDYVSGFIDGPGVVFATSGDGALYKYERDTLKLLDLSSPEDYDLTCVSLAGPAVLTGTLRRFLNVYRQDDICIPQKVLKTQSPVEFLIELRSGLCLAGLGNGEVHVILPDPLQDIGIIATVGRSAAASAAAVSADQSLGIFASTNLRLQIVDMAWTCGDPGDVKDIILETLGIKNEESTAENQKKIGLNTAYMKEKQLFDANGEELEEMEENNSNEESYEEFEESSESTATSDMFEELSEMDEKYQKKNAAYGQDGKIAAKRAFFQGI